MNSEGTKHSDNELAARHVPAIHLNRICEALLREMKRTGRIRIFSKKSVGQFTSYNTRSYAKTQKESSLDKIVQDKGKVKKHRMLNALSFTYRSFIFA